MLDFAVVEKEVRVYRELLAMHADHRAAREYSSDILAYIVRENDTPDFAAVLYGMPMAIQYAKLVEPKLEGIIAELSKDDRLIVGSMPKHYVYPLKPVDAIATLKEVFTRLGVEIKIGRRGANDVIASTTPDRDLYVIVQRNGRVPKTQINNVLGIDVRYGDLVVNERTMKPREFQQYLARLKFSVENRDLKIDSPVFVYNADGQRLAEAAMTLFAMKTTEQQLAGHIADPRDPYIRTYLGRGDLFETYQRLFDNVRRKLAQFVPTL
ncbi:MAG: hypothetical protein Q8R04_02230 [Nanoarchaeota archaeon]|nr:hypothetical protein [Nanoarchaeota archaeon]